MRYQGSTIVRRAPKDGVSPTVVNTVQTYAYADGVTNTPTIWYGSIADAAASNDPNEYPYLWTRVVVTYSDGKTSESYTVAKDGKGISSVTTYYQFTETEEEPTTWPNYRTIAEAANNNPNNYIYLWVKVLIVYTDGTKSSYTSVTQQGTQGDTGLQGCIYTMTEYEDGTLYRNDTGLSAAEILSQVTKAVGEEKVATIDLTPQIHRVTITENGVLQGMYLCKLTHLSSAETKPDPSDPNGKWTEYWTAVSTQNPTYFPTLFASNAVMRFGQANQIIIVNDNQIVAGVSGGSADTDIIFWAGGERKDVTQDGVSVGATWLVRKDGTGYAAGGNIKFEKTGITVNGSVFSVDTTNGENDTTNWGTLNCFAPNYKDSALISVTPTVPLTTLVINDPTDTSTNAAGRNTITLGGGMQIFSDATDYNGVVSFNRRISDGLIYNSKWYAFQLADIQGDLILSRFKSESGGSGGRVGIFTQNPTHDFHIAGGLYADSIETNKLTPTSLEIGDATLYWDSENKVLKIDGGNLVVQNDVIALGSSDSENTVIGNLNDLLDVSASNLEDGQVLVWDAGLSKWVNQTITFESGSGGSTDADLKQYATISYVQSNYLGIDSASKTYVKKTDYNSEIASIQNSLSDKADAAVLEDYAKASQLEDGSVTKLGTESVGSSKVPIYLNAGVPTICNTELSVSITGTAAIAKKLGQTTVGATNTPIYINEGTATPCSSTLNVSITGNAATATKASSADTASTATSASSATYSTYAEKLGTASGATSVGESARPVYFSAGKPIRCGNSLSVSITGNAATASRLGTGNVGSLTKPIYLLEGAATECSDTLGVSITGNAATATAATKLATARKIFGNSFDGTGSITGPLILGVSDYDATDDSSRTLIIGGGFQIFADKSDYTGVISFNRQMNGGKIFNPLNYAFQLADIKGDLLLSRFKDADTTDVNGGRVGIFTGTPRADVDIAATLWANNVTISKKLILGNTQSDYYVNFSAQNVSGNLILDRFKDSKDSLGGGIGIFTDTPRADVDIAGHLIVDELTIEKLNIGEASIYWDSTNKAVRILGGSIIVENDVIATGTKTASGVKSLVVDNIMSDNDYLGITAYSDVSVTSDNSSIRIKACDDIYFTSDNEDYNELALSTIIAKINELAKAAGKTTL